MRTKKYIYNSAAFAALQILTFLVGMVLPRMYLECYGSAINGLMSSTVQLISYFSYVEAGLGNALIYALYKPLAEKDISKINCIVSTAKKSYIKASGQYFLLVICLSIIYPFIIKNEGIDTYIIVSIILIIGFFGALDFYTMAKYRVLLTADQREYVVSMVSVLALLFNFIFIVLLIRSGASILLVRSVPLFSIFIRSPLLYIYVKHRYSYIKYNMPSDPVHLVNRWDALVMELSEKLSLSAPVIIVSIFCSLKMASVYSVYNLVFAGLIGIISIFTAGVSASFGNVVARNEFLLLEKVHDQFEFTIFCITSVLYSCALILVNPFISIYTKGITDIDYENPLYGILFVVWGILHDARIPYIELVKAAGLYRETRRVNIMHIIVLLLLSVILVRPFGIEGILIALIIATLFRDIKLILVVKPLVIKAYSNAKTPLRIIRMLIIAVISYIPFLFWIRIAAYNLYEWFLWAAGVTVWCCTLTLLVNYLFDRKVFLDTACRLKAFMFVGRRSLGA